MPQLLLTSQPGFTEIADSAFDAGAAATAANMKALNSDTKFAAVRTEFFWGFYKHLETVQLPVSPADGYAYARTELLYMAVPYWSAAAGGALNGVQYDPLDNPPPRGATSGQGHLLEFGFHVHQKTGVVSCDVHYHKDGGQQSNTNDGILMVITIAQRLRG